LLIDTSSERRTNIDRREAQLLSLAFIFLLLGAMALSIAYSAKFQSWSTAGVKWTHFIILPVWASGAWIIRRTARKTDPDRDPFLLPIALFLAGWGMLVIWRLAPGFGLRQTGWFVLSCLILIVVLQGRRDLQWLRKYRYLWITLGIGLVFLTLLFGTSPTGSPPHLWLGCCGVYFQPSEPLRLILIAFLASFLADRVTVEQDGIAYRGWKSLLPLMIIWLIAIALLVLQRDMGTGSLFLAIFAFLLYLATGRWLVLAMAIILTLIGAVLGVMFVDVVALRLEAWVNPWLDPIGGSYQIVQSLIAIASGGTFGRGLGMGNPEFVPAAHTDFIFTAISEEWGLIGGLGIIALFVILVSRGIKAAAGSEEPFRTLLAGGISIALGLQAVLIIGGATRFLPLVGITLPFVSYGGSSLLTSFVALGLVLHISGGREGANRFTKPIKHVHLFLLLLWGLLAINLGWWSLYRSSNLVARLDNPRRAVQSKFVERGRILDRDGNVLAESLGDPGSYARSYPQTGAAHVVGFDTYTYGQSGIEASMDAYLRGELGVYEVSYQWDKVLRGFNPAGADVQLTLDSDLQQKAAESISGYEGAVVILDGFSGEIMALASSPSFDPNLFEEQWQDLTESEKAPLINRTTQGKYQPGTALAPFLYAWGLREGVLKEPFHLDDLDRVVPVDGGELTCAEDQFPQEVVGYNDAVQRGCPALMEDIGRQMEFESFGRMLELYGFDHEVDLRLSAGEPQVALELDPSDPSAEYIGQGALTVTPIQIARAFATLISPSQVPELKLIRAINGMDSDRPIDPDHKEGEPAHSGEIQRLIWGALWDEARAAYAVSGNALSGPAKDLGWFMGGQIYENTMPVIVVIVEGENSTTAQKIGLELLKEVE
jgi:cell division protein FtsW (lipid II flippase)